MEAAEPSSAVSLAGLLGVPAPGPGPSDSDDDDCQAAGGIRPKSSPLPRRKSSSSEDEPDGAPRRGQPAGSGQGRRRRVSFADARGLRLALVREFDSWDFPGPAGRDQGRAEAPEEVGACRLSFPSPLPGPPEALAARVRAQKIELESVELLPGTTVLRGVVRVLNVSFRKAVFVRTTLDAWASHFDLLAEYVPGSGDGATDRFAFKLTLVPPFGERGARVDFCLRYETPEGTFWANNGGENYAVLCHQRAKDAGEAAQGEAVCRKGCLKASRQNFTTVETSSLEENVQSIERMITTGVSRNVGDLKPTPVADSQSATSEEECHKLTVESSQKNASRRNRRRVARQAKVKDLLSQRDLTPERATENEEKSFPEPPPARARRGENPVKSSSGSPPRSDGPSARVKGNVSPAQSRESSVAERSGSVDAVDAVQPPSADSGEATATHARRPRFEEELEQGQHSAAFTTGGNRQRPLESTGRGDRGSDTVCIVNNAGAESHSDGRLTESTEVPVTAPNGFTFGTVLAPLYPLVWGRGVKSEDHNLADQLKSMRELSRTGDSDVENSISLDLTENNEETPRISRDPFESHDRKPMNTPLNDVPVDVGRLCGSAAPDTGTKPTDVDRQESEHERTGKPDNPRRTADEDTTPSDVNNDMLNACSNRAGLNHQGKAEKGPQALGCQWKNPHEKQIVEAAAKAQTEAGEVFSEIQTHLNPTQTLSQPRVLQETTGAAPQPRLSPSASAREIQAMDRQSRCDVTTGFIRTHESNEPDGVVPTMTVSTANIHPQQGREIEQLEEQDPKCLMRPVMFEAADISVGDQGIPKLEDEPGCSAVDLSQETLKTSLGVVEGPDNGGGESTNNLVDGDITTTVEHEDSVDVSECIKVNRASCTHPDMLVRGIGLTLVEKPVCMQAEAEHGTSEDAATTQDYSPYEDRIGDKNWEMMVEDEEKDPLGEVVGKEGAENGEKENNELEEEQTIAEQQISERTVESGKREHAETESEGHKHICATEGKSGIEMETVEEVLVWEEQEVDEEEVKKAADHGTDDRHGACEEIRNKVRENLAERDRKTQVEGEDKTERISVEVNGAGEGGMVVESVVKTAKNEGTEDTERSPAGPNRPGSDPSKPLSNVHEREAEKAIDKENSSDNETTSFQTEMRFISEEEEGRSNTHSLHLTNGQSKALSVSAESCAAEKGSLVFDEEPVCHPMAEEREGDSSSSESDEEMELYMHLLRAAPSPQTLRSFPRDGGSGGKGSHTGKRHSIDRPAVLPSSMPAISESENEEPLTRIPDGPEERHARNVQAEATPLPAQDNQEYEGDTTGQWTDALSGSNILKSLLYITVFVVFVVVAYHYDFLACFALYLLSIFWLVLPSRQTASLKQQ